MSRSSYKLGVPTAGTNSSIKPKVASSKMAKSVGLDTGSGFPATTRHFLIAVRSSLTKLRPLEVESVHWQPPGLIDIEAKDLGIHATENVEERDEKPVQQCPMGRVCDGIRRERILRGRDENGPKFGVSRPYMAYSGGAVSWR